MSLVDDIVLVDELRDYVNVKQERWQETVESKGFKMGHINTEQMNCNFNGECKEK